MKISDTYEQIFFVPAICRARPFWRLRHCVPHLRSKIFTNHLPIPGLKPIKQYLKYPKTLFITLRNCVPLLIKIFHP